jgi:hypothetical protein
MISNNLLDRTFVYFDKFKNFEEVVSPSLPILYFGDLTAYKNSNTKVLTVGKNPSNNEFRLKKNESYSFVRFPDWNESSRNLLPSLNSYFKYKPLKIWFSSFEPILNGMSTSYYEGDYPNIALHTDICSPLSTDPTWSRLPKQTQMALFNEGVGIWKDLIEELQPDVMLVSVPRALFLSVFKTEGQKLVSFTEKKDGSTRKPYVVEVHDYILNSGKGVKVVFGQAANRPFDTIHDLQKKRIGELCQK